MKETINIFMTIIIVTEIDVYEFEMRIEAEVNSVVARVFFKFVIAFVLFIIDIGFTYVLFIPSFIISILIGRCSKLIVNCQRRISSQRCH